MILRFNAERTRSHGLRNDQQGILTDAAKNVGRAHCPDSDMSYAGSIVLRSVQEGSANVLTDPLESRLLEHVFARNDSEQLKAEPLEPLTRRLGNRFKLLRFHFVHDHT